MPYHHSFFIDTFTALRMYSLSVFEECVTAKYPNNCWIFCCASELGSYNKRGTLGIRGPHPQAVQTWLAEKHRLPRKGILVLGEERE